MDRYRAFTLKAEQGQRLRAIITDIVVSTENAKAAVKAVWDTGATITCISERIAKELGLAPIGFERINTASGIAMQSQYIVDIVLPNNVGIRGIRVSSFCGGAGVDALIGMDIITAGDFSITNANGRTVVSYRIPPDVFPIDYVATQKNDKRGKLLKSQLSKIKTHEE